SSARTYPHCTSYPRIALPPLQTPRVLTVLLAARFFRAARHPFHHAPIPAAADRESVLRQSTPQHARLFIVRVTFARPRTSKYRDDKFFPHLQSSTLLWVFALTAALWRRYVELLDRRHAQSGQGIRGFVTLSTLIVAQKRKNQPPTARRFRKSRESSNVFDGPRLGMNPPRRRRVFHAVFQRAVYSRHRQRSKVGPEPGLFLRKVQQRHDGPRRHQIVPRQSRSVRLNHIARFDSRRRVEVRRNFHQIIRLGLPSASSLPV